MTLLETELPNLNLDATTSNAEVMLPSSMELVEKFISKGLTGVGTYDPDTFIDGVDGIYFCPDQAEASNLPHLTGFDILASGFELGAAASHHEVLFGEARVANSDGVHTNVKVAIKPFDTYSRAAEHERNCLLEVKRKGFDTFEPLALAKDGNTTFLITRFRDDIISLDNEPWSISPSDLQRYESEVVPELLFIADTMAQQHAKGVFHGDALPRNTIKTDTGGFVVMDLEDATIAIDNETHVRLMNGDDCEEGKAFMDLTHYWHGLTHPIQGDEQNVFLQGESFEVYMREFDERFLTPYFEALAEHTDPTLHEKFDVARIRQAVYTYAATH